MTTFVPNGQTLDLELEISGPGSESIKNFEFIFTRATDLEQVERVRGTVGDKKMGSGSWTAKGLKNNELNTRINWVAKADDIPAFGGGELVVYHDTIELVTKDADGEAVEKALCHIQVTPDREYTDPAHTGSTRRTDGRGKVVFDDLPPGEVEVSIRTPYKLLEWVTKEGTKRECKIDKSYSAKLVWPNPKTLGGKPHKQYVNEATDPLQPQQGSLMKLKVEVDVETTPGGGIRGDSLFVKVEFGAKNSARNDSPKPMFGTNAGGAGLGPFVVEKKLTADAQTVEFDLELGAAGGDEVTISVGADEACTDGTIEVVSWRKLWIKPVRPQQFPLPGEVLDPDLQAKINETLLPTFIEAVFETAQVIQDNRVVVIDQNRAQALGMTNHALAPFIFFAHANPEKQIMGGVVSDNPLRLFWLLAHGFFETSTEKFMLKFKGRTSAWQTSTEANSFLPISPDGDSVLLNWRDQSAGTIHKHTGMLTGNHPAQVGYWELDDRSARGNILDAYLDVHASEPKFRLRLPNTLGIGRRASVNAYVNMTTFSYTAGSSSGNWVASSVRTNPLATLYTILHELGHSIGHAVTGNSGMPGLPGTHDYHYIGKGHEGDHCNYGLSTSNRAKTSYSPLVLKGTHGTCIMFGGIGPKTKYAKALKFCPICEPYVKATKFTSIG